jgi:hypothetical protein
MLNRDCANRNGPIAGTRNREISEANRLYMLGSRKMPGAIAAHERWLQRLQDILDELVSLTDWKKV